MVCEERGGAFDKPGRPLPTGQSGKQLIIGTVSTGEMALRLLEDYLKPDLILMDIGLAGSLDGIETA